MKVMMCYQAKPETEQRVFVSALCDACRQSQSPVGLLSHMTELPRKMTSYLQIPSLLPIDSAYSLAQRYLNNNWITVNIHSVFICIKN